MWNYTKHILEQWDVETQSVAQAYFGTCIPSFPNFFIMMGPNTVTGHLSVIYTVECQINFTLRLLAPIIQSLPSYRSQLLPSLTPKFLRPTPKTVEVRYEAAIRDTEWTQREAKKLVWNSGCVNWAIDEKTGMNNMMYPDWQYWYWLRSVFWKRGDFLYRDERTGKEAQADLAPKLVGMVAMGALVYGVIFGREWVVEELPRRVKDFDPKMFVSSVLSVRG
jgi:hypothetical protein